MFHSRFSICCAAVVAWGTLGSSAHAVLLLPSVGSGTLELWLKADAGVTYDGSNNVSQWADQSGNGNHANQGNILQQPQFVPGAVPISNQPVIRFDGLQNNTNGDYLQGTGAVDVASAGYTSFMVYNRFSQGSEPSELAPVAIGVPGQANQVRAYYIRTGFSATPQEMSFSGWGNDHGSSHTVVGDTFHIWTDRISSPGTGAVTLDMYESNSVAAATTDFSYTTAFGGLASVNAGYYVGGLGSQTRNFKGDIAELIVYRGALSDEDRLAVEYYLELKYLAAPIPEPSTLALLGLGAIGLAVKARRRRAAS